MCTLSWLTTDDGYALWFNRDELNSRGLESPPTLHETSTGVSWLSPTDPDSGGTWMMTNAHGVTCVLLNRYPTGEAQPAARTDQSPPSRGRLVPLTAGARTAVDAIEAIRGECLIGTAGFHAVALDARGGIHELRWDGVAGHLASGADVAAPLTSSSVRADEVAAARRAAYPADPSLESLTDYHHAHDPTDGAISVNMCRSDANTRSVSQVRVTADWVALDYEPQAWWLENTTPPSHHRLTRLRPVSLHR